MFILACRKLLTREQEKLTLCIKPNITLLRILYSSAQVQTSMTVDITVQHVFFCGLREQSILTDRQTSQYHQVLYVTLGWLYTHKIIF